VPLSTLHHRKKTYLNGTRHEVLNLKRYFSQILSLFESLVQSFHCLTGTEKDTLTVKKATITSLTVNVIYKNYPGYIYSKHNHNSTN
jgi:hypothetical protein